MHPFVEAKEELALFVRIVQVVAGRQWRDEPVDFLQRHILRTIRKGGPTTPSELARYRHITRQSAIKELQQIVPTGFIDTKPNPANKKSRLFDLTPVGLRYIDAHDVKVVGLLAETLGEPGLIEELQQCIQTGRRMRRRLEIWLIRHGVI
jgi:DNA-binding MarR family transcriptional regulator